MKSDKTKALFDAITGIDEDLIDEAASPSRLHPARTILRVAAIAAVIALLMTALLWPDKDGNVAPYFSVYVYANETDCEKLTLYSSVISSWDAKKDPSYRPEFDSNFGNFGEGNPHNTPLYTFHLQIRIDEELQNNPMDLFIDGKKHGQTDTVMITSPATDHLTGEKATPWPAVVGYVEKPTSVDILLYAKNGSVLQQYSLIITPINEGYKIELAKAYVSQNGQNIFVPD